MDIDIGLWRKPMGSITPAEWEDVSPFVETLVKRTCTVMNNNMSMRMLCDEVRTGVTQFAAGGIKKLPPVKGKALVAFMMILLKKAKAPVDCSAMTLEELTQTCVGYMEAGVEFQSICAERVKKFAMAQKNPAYAFRGLSRSSQLLNESKGEHAQQMKEISEIKEIVKADAENNAAMKAAVDALLSGKSTPPQPTNETARRAVLDLWDDFNEGKLDAQIPGGVRVRNCRTFLEYCGNLGAYKRQTPDGEEIVTVNDCLPGGEEQLKDWLHTRSQAKYMRTITAPKRKRQNKRSAR